MGLLTLLLAFSPAVPQQTGPPPGSREAMWPAPTAEDWALPCLIRWERTYDDALAVSAETQRPILICVNMDGEIASEHYAGIRYRREETAALYQPYVCVIASVYRHTPRDHDAEGNRVPCPRFGTVTCGEHIAIEPVLHQRYFEDTRVAPRHIMVELDKSETYDVYYAFDTASVFETIRKGIAERDVEPRELPRGDRPLGELVASRHVADREAVETLYRTGDRATRTRLLERAIDLGEHPPDDLLRMAVFGFDLELSKLARQALASSSSPGSVDLINEALRVPMDAAEREALIAALERIGESTPRAKTFAVVHRGLSAGSGAVDVDGWSAALDGSESAAPPPEWSALAAQIEYRADATDARPDDPEARLQLAESWLALAVDPETAAALGADQATSPKYATLLFEDVRRAAREAEELGASGWRVDAAVALSSYYLGEFGLAQRRAEAAVRALPAGEESWNAMAVLGLFAQGRRNAIARAARAGESWPPEWVTDVHSAYSVIARHPLGTDLHAVAHYDFLADVRATGQAARVLTDGLTRFPDSQLLHDRLRANVLRERGVDALEETYEALLAREDASPNLVWFAGYTSLVAAEFHRRAATPAKAEAAYGRGIAHFERYIAAHPEQRDSSDHYVALALAGQARVALEAGEAARALGGVLASFDRRPLSAANLDGLGISPVGTAQMLRASLLAEERTAEVEQLDAALERLRALDPALLELPAFERGGPRPQGGWRRGGGGRDGR
ncbi:MAG: hypothetical protein AAF682_21045 [Planctomycetota bacterium]